MQVKINKGSSVKWLKFTYTNLQNSTFDGQKIDKAVFTYSDLQLQTGDGDNVMWPSGTPRTYLW